MTPKQKAWAIQAEHVIKQMERRHFNAYYCSTKEEALSKALSIIEKGAVIASGGSATIEEVGLLNYIKTHSEEYTFIDRSIAKNEEEKRQIHAKAILSDYYLMSTNAFTMKRQSRQRTLLWAKTCSNYYWYEQTDTICRRCI